MVTMKHAPLLRLESDDDPGAAARLLDLFATQRRWPVEFQMRREESSAFFEARFQPDQAIASSLLARVLQLPGMRRVEIVAPSS